MAWRYFAQRLDRAGGLVPLDWNVPAQDVAITEVLSGPPSLDFRITPEYARMVGSDGLPIFRKWSTAVFAEDQGKIHAGGIVEDIKVDGPELSVSCVGYTGYPKGQPYRGSVAFVEVDPLDVFRHVWYYIQAQPNLNLGIVMDGTKTGLKIGSKLEQGEFDTQNGPLTFEAGPVKLNWYETHDMGSFLDDLASQYGFDWREDHSWRSDGTIEHRIRFGYPELGTRRERLRFVLGENISRMPTISGPGDSYANGVLLLGRGEGRTMIRGEVYKDDGALPRYAVVEDKVQNTTSRAVAAAKRQLALRKGVWTIETFNVRNDSLAPLGSYNVGDEILVTAREDWAYVDAWCRVLSLTYSPEEADEVQVTVQRSDTLVV